MDNLNDDPQLDTVYCEQCGKSMLRKDAVEVKAYSSVDGEVVDYICEPCEEDNLQNDPMW